MTQINWHLLGRPGPQNALASMMQGYQFGSQMRADREAREAAAARQDALAGVYSNPDDRDASGRLFQLDPELAIQVSGWQDERQFRSALGDYMTGSTNALLSSGGGVQSQPTVNALAPSAGQTALGAYAPDAPKTGDGFAPLAPPAGPVGVDSQPQAEGLDLSALGEPQTAQDRAFLRMVQIDPMRAIEIQSVLRDEFLARAQAESEFYTVAVEELSRVADEAGWQNALQRIAPIAQAMGADLSRIPRNYPGPDAVRGLLEDALPVKERLDYFLREANYEADNARADRNTDSLIETREGRLAEYGRHNRASEGNQRRGQNMSSADRRRGQDMTDRRARSRGGSAAPRVTVQGNEPTATGANGETLVVRNGQWVEAN